MSFGNNKVLKVTRWSSRLATSGNWTYNWFGGWRLLGQFDYLGAALRFFGKSCFSRLFKWWYLHRSTGFRRTDSRFGDGETFRQVSLFRHVDGLRVARSACWLLTVSEVSSISPEDLSILVPDFKWSHIHLLLYTSFEPSTRPVCRLYTHNFSFAQVGKFLGTDVVVLGLQLFSLQELSSDILNYFGFAEFTGRRNQCPSTATKHSLWWRTFQAFRGCISPGQKN